MISKEAKFIEKILKAFKIRNLTSKMMLNPKRKHKFEEPPRNFYRKYEIESRTIEGMKCSTVKVNANLQKHIIYFHGGAYTLEANRGHWIIIDRIMEKFYCKITFVNYPLAPENSCESILKRVKNAYNILSREDDLEIILMGDSAGGGLALSLAQCISIENNLKKPKKLVLFSPWLDVSMSDEISKDLANRDLILNKETLKTIGKVYADELDLINPLCSPIYGNSNNVGEIALFTGTNDILNVQACKLKEICDKVSLFEYKGMQHVWMGYPIPEAKMAILDVAKFLNEKS